MVSLMCCTRCADPRRGAGGWRLAALAALWSGTARVGAAAHARASPAGVGGGRDRRGGWAAHFQNCNADRGSTVRGEVHAAKRSHGLGARAFMSLMSNFANSYCYDPRKCAGNLDTIWILDQDVNSEVQFAFDRYRGR